MFGVPIERQPETLAEFYEYFERMVEEELAVTSALADVVDATMRPELPFVARPLVEALNLATVGLLPPRLRDELGAGAGPEPPPARARVARGDPPGAASASAPTS